MRSLAAREQRARRLSEEPEAMAAALGQIWEEAAHFPSAARQFWPAGRDAALALLALDRREAGAEALRRLLLALQPLELEGEIAGVLQRAAPQLTDEELLALVMAGNPSAGVVAALTPPVRDRVASLLRCAGDATSTPEVTRLLGRFLSASQSPPTSASEAAAERPLAARGLRFSRAQGAETAAGIRYEALYALSRFLAEDDIVELDFQDLEDIGLIHRATDGRTEREHVQAKKRDNGWSIPDLQAGREGANAVFDSFAAVALAEPGARLTFASDARLNRGLAPYLERLAEKFRDVSTEPAQLEAAGVGLNDTEQKALAQLAGRMEPGLRDRITLPELLAWVRFDTGRPRSELRLATIGHLSTRLAVPFERAELVHREFVGLFVEAMEGRKRFGRAELEALIERAGVAANAFGAATTGGLTEVLDFSRPADTTADRFYQGRSAGPADIAAGLDALRPNLLAEVDRALASRRCCIIRAPSGQGKTTLMYRSAYEAREEHLVIRAHRLGHAGAAEILRLVEPLRAAPVLVLIDDLAARDRGEWPGALRRLLERPNVQVLATSREDVWRVAEVARLGEIVDFVRPTLDEHTAEVIFAGLREVEGLTLHAEDWREPFAQAGGLLMEYVHLLTQGRRMRDLIAEQLADLERRLGDRGTTVLAALRFIAAAHAYGGYLTRETLGKLLPGGGTLGLGRALGALEEEFWVRDVAGGRYAGLHQVRSEVVTAVLHEADPPGETLERLLAVADADEIGAMLEGLLYHAADVYPGAVDALADRSGWEGARFALRVATAIYAVEERHHADAAFAAFANRAGRRRRATLAVYNLLPRPIDLSAVVPAHAREQVRAELRALPRRRWEDRAERRFLAAVGPERLAEWLPDAATTAEAAELLRLLGLVAPDLGRAALAQAGVEPLVRRVVETEASSVADLLGALREVDVATAAAVADRLGVAILREAAVATTPGCFAVQADGDTVRARFLVEGDQTPNEVAVRVTAALYGLFPRAIRSQVTGMLETGTPLPHPDADKRIPRESVPPSPHQIALNQFWLALCNERLAGRSLVAVLRQHDEYGRLLLNALSATHRALDEPSTVAARATLGDWEAAATFIADVPYLPYRSDPLLAVLGGDGAPHAMPGSHPFDRALDGIDGAVAVARREILNHLRRRDFNRAILHNALAEFQLATARYREQRATFGLLADDGPRWDERLVILAVRLREVLALLTALRPDRSFRAGARRLFEPFAELRALARDLVDQARRAVVAGTPWAGGAERVAALDAVLARSAEDLAGWRPAAALSALAVLLATVAAEDEDGGETRRAAVDGAFALLTEVDVAGAIDVEAWLAAGEEEGRLRQLGEQVADELGRRDVRATCTVLPFSLETPLWRTATVTVAVDDLRRLAGFREAVRDIGFGILPESVQQVILLLAHQEGRGIPRGFMTWRGPGWSGNPTNALNPIAPWSPLGEADVGATAARLGLVLDGRDHQVAAAIDAAREAQVAFVLSLGRLTAVLEAVNDPDWTTRDEKVLRQAQATLDRCRAVSASLQELGGRALEDPSWSPVAAFTVDAIGAHLAWLAAKILGQATPEELASIEERLAAADIHRANKLYLDLDTAPADSPAIGDAIERAIAAHTAIADLLGGFLDEMMAQMAGPATGDPSEPIAPA